MDKVKWLVIERESLRIANGNATELSWTLTLEKRGLLNQTLNLNGFTLIYSQHHSKRIPYLEQYSI